MEESASPIGEVTHFYSNLGVAIVKLTTDLATGAKIQFKGSTTDLEEDVVEMQYEYATVETGKKGQEIGIKVSDKVRDGDKVYLVA